MEQAIYWHDSPYRVLLLLAGVATSTLTLLAWKLRGAPVRTPSFSLAWGCYLTGGLRSSPLH
jgi:hypothetical protein